MYGQYDGALKSNPIYMASIALYKRDAREACLSISITECCDIDRH